MKIDLQKYNILVTGASRGIGAAIAKELALNKMTEPTNIHQSLHYWQVDWPIMHLAQP